MVARAWRLRLVAAMLWSVCAAQAGPPLVTIQDTLYKADGTPFNGFLLIEWKSFEASDASNIATHSLTAPIVKGVFQVRLVPNATGSSYTVRYSSDGKVQFTEIWVVPESAAPLRLKDVRTATVPPDQENPPGEVTEVQESDVIGLVADLAARPVKGAAYRPAAALATDASGALVAVEGDPQDCVHADGSTGPCGSDSGGSGPGFVDGEAPAGLINGTNGVFSLADTPSPAESLAVYRNGLLQKLEVDYLVAGNVITFTSASVPQPGDTLVASYRVTDPDHPVGQAGGALAGTYPNPSLAYDVVSDANVAEMAGIRESKLALNYATHTNANDPTAEQKAALSGTAGTPAEANKFVTDQDPRLTDARTPASHTLLGAAHSDTVEAALVRGDVLVAQGTPVRWTRVPLGAANRCLMSNGFDAVWNTCLYTAFPAGAVPFADTAGNLAQNSASLVWDNSNRKFSVGNNAGSATLYLWDAQPTTGVTTLAVRAGQGQGTTALARWLDASGSELARIDADGRVAGASFRAATSSTRAAWQDAGAAADPGTRSDGDVWFNTTVKGRKTAEGGQVHTVPQVLCSSTGAATSSTALAQLGTCTIPAGYLKPGDRIDIRFDYSHEGTTKGFSFEVRWGATAVVSRSAAAGDTMVSGRLDAGVHTSGAQVNGQSWGSALAIAAAGTSASDSVAAPITVAFLGRMATSGSETLTLRNFTVVRYPVQQNP